MKQIRSLQQKLTPTAANWRWVLFWALCALTGLSTALAARLVDTQSIFAALSCLGRAELWYTVLFLALLCGFLASVTRSLFLGGLLTTLPAVLIDLVNYYKLAITSTPLQLTEFALISRVGDIAALNAKSITVSPHTALAILTAAAWLLVLLFFSRPLRPAWRRSLPAAPVLVLLFLLFFRAGADSLVYTPLDASFDQSLNQTVSNDRCGVLLGLWRTFLRKEKNALTDSYSRSYMDYLVSQAEEELPAVLEPPGRKKPNIILILSESFFDVTTLPGVTYEEDPLKEFHALREEGVSGAFHTRTLGYGTCNIELEILTGINTTLLNREELCSMDPDLLTRLPTVPSLLKEAGYETAMFHMFDDSIYHRAAIFRELGFDDTYFPADFGRIDPEAAAADDYWAFLEEHIAGDFYSDSYMTDLFIDLYEGREGEAPLFLYGISMENHTPHNGSKYADDGYTVAFTSPLSEEGTDILRDAAQGAANASQALGRLCDYFRAQEEPTVILFYGDHRPTLALGSSAETVYSSLGLSVGLDQSVWSAEQLAGLHATDFLIWSNDPDYLPGDPGTVVDTSSNYFGLSVLEAADLPLPLYWRALKQTHETRMIDTLEYHLGRDGSVSKTTELLTAAETDRLSRLSLFLYDALYGSGYVTDRLWQ